MSGMVETARGRGAELRRPRSPLAIWLEQSGASAAEFALVLPILITVLFGVIQFGSVLFVYNNMQNAAREAAREFAVGKLTTEAATRAYAENYLANWDLPFNVVVSLPGTQPAPNDKDIKVTITAPAAQAALIGFPPLWGASTLTVFANFREEG